MKALIPVNCWKNISSRPSTSGRRSLGLVKSPREAVSWFAEMVREIGKVTWRVILLSEQRLNPFLSQVQKVHSTSLLKGNDLYRPLSDVTSKPVNWRAGQKEIAPLQRKSVAPAPLFCPPVQLLSHQLKWAYGEVVRIGSITISHLSKIYEKLRSSYCVM